MVRRCPRLDDHLRRFLRYRTGQHSLATRRALLARSQGNRILPLYYNELGRKPPHRSDIPLAHGSHHSSWSLRVLCRAVSFGVDLLFVLFPRDCRLDVGRGPVGV